MFTGQLDICARTNLFAVKAMHISQAQAPQHYDAAILPQKNTEHTKIIIRVL